MAVKILRTTVTLNTLRSRRLSAANPERIEKNQAPRYGRADRKLFCEIKTVTLNY